MENEVKGISRFKSAKVSKKVKFCGEDIEIKKLSLGQVLEIQELAKAKEGEDSSFAVLITVLKYGAPELSSSEDDEFKEIPMDELSTLSGEIMKYSGMVGK
jgi:hypothetical protein